MPWPKSCTSRSQVPPPKPVQREKPGEYRQPEEHDARRGCGGVDADDGEAPDQTRLDGAEVAGHR